MPIRTIDETPPMSCELGRARDTRLPEKPKRNALWFVAAVKSRMERSLAWDLKQQGHSYFLPMQRVAVRSGGKSKPGMRVLFPGYIFVLGGPVAKFAVVDSKKSYAIIDVPKSAQSRLIDELDALRRVSCVLRFDRFDRVLPGVECRFHSGPLAGLTGTIIDRKDKADGVVRVSLKVQMFGCSIFETTADQLETL